MTPVTRVRPTLTSNDLVRGRSLSQPRPVATGAPIDYGYSTVSPRPIAAPRPVSPRVAPAVARAPMAQPNVAGMTGFARENTLANSGVYDAGSVGAANAVANGTGRVYRPPQQTERANPLTGDNNFPVEGQTTAVARAPFVQRGASIPTGQDAAPVRETMTEDDDIASSMAGTQARLRGAPSPYARRFGSQSQSSVYNSLLKRVLAPS